MRVLLIGLLLAACAGCRPGTAECAERMKRMYEAELIRSLAHRNSMKQPSLTGRAFWIAGQKYAPGNETYVCPYSATLPGVGTTTYRGPAISIGRSWSTEVIGACIGIHPDGSSTLLRKDGTVILVPKEDPEVAKALAATSD